MKNGTELVYVRLIRPPGYEDVHAELVVEDAMNPAWPWDLVGDEGKAVLVALERPEGYEESSVKELAHEAVKSTWPAWAVHVVEKSTLQRGCR